MGVCFEDVNTIRGNIESMAQRFKSSKYNLDKKLFNSGVFIINHNFVLFKNAIAKCPEKNAGKCKNFKVIA